MIYLEKEYYMDVNTAISGIESMEALRVERTENTLSYVDDRIRSIGSRAARNLEELQAIVDKCEKESRPVPLSVLSLISSQSTILDPLKRLRTRFESRLNGRSFSIVDSSNFLDNLRSTKGKKKKKKTPEEIFYDIIRAKINCDITPLVQRGELSSMLKANYA
jgi:hypothetical protein